MTTADILNTLSNINNGAFFHVEYETDLGSKLTATAKRNGYTITKRTNAVVRKGITYDNMKNVKEKRENHTLPEQNAGLPWGVWKIFNLLIENKGVDYLRLYTAQNNHPHSIYYLNGNEISYNDLKNLGVMQNSFFNGKPSAEDCFTIKCSGIISIG